MFDHPTGPSMISSKCSLFGVAAAFLILASACSDATAPIAGSDTPVTAGQTAQASQSVPCSTLTAGALVCPAPGQSSATTAWRTVSAGGDHTCALRGDGALFCWGSDRDGQLGVAHATSTCGDGSDSYACSTVPARSQSGSSFASVSAGARHTCAITTALQALCWGANDAGQLGAASSGAAAVVVPGGGAWVQISAGSSHTCAVRIDGAAYCWGANERGQLGNGTTSPTVGPVAVALPEAIVAVSAGQGRTCGRTAAGTVYCWGATWMNRTDGLEMSRAQPVPQVVPGSSALAGLSVGVFTTCGVDRSAAAVCWEGNPRGELGNGTQQGATSPVRVAGTEAFAQISSGLVQSCGVTVGGAVYCWGDGTFGQLATDPKMLSERCDTQFLPCSTVPVSVRSSAQFAQISTGFGSHVCAVSGAGEIYCWGLGVSGQLGDGSSAIRPAPARIATPAD